MLQHSHLSILAISHLFALSHRYIALTVHGLGRNGLLWVFAGDANPPNLTAVVHSGFVSNIFAFSDSQFVTLSTPYIYVTNPVVHA